MLGNDNIMTVNASEVVQKISTDEKDGMYDSQLSQHNDDAKNILLNFLMCVQIASTDTDMATQNFIQNTACLQN